MAQSGGFREILLGAVDHGLPILGASVRQAIYDGVERSHAIEREEIPARLALFHGALIPAVGAGGNFVERLLARDPYDQLGLDFLPHQEWVLLGYAGQALKSTMLAPTTISHLK